MLEKRQKALMKEPTEWKNSTSITFPTFWPIMLVLVIAFLYLSHFFLLAVNILFSRSTRGYVKDWSHLLLMMHWKKSWRTFTKSKCFTTFTSIWGAMIWILITVQSRNCYLAKWNGHYRYKDYPDLSHRIVAELNLEVSPAQISKKLKVMGFKFPSKRRMAGMDVSNIHDKDTETAPLQPS